MPSEFRSEPAVSLAEAAAFMRRRFWIILLTCLIALGIGVYYLLATVPIFTATAELVVNAKASSGDATSVSTIVESQIGIIKSQSIASAVIEKFGLAEDPEFAHQDSVWRGLAVALIDKLGVAEDREATGPDSFLSGVARSLSRLLGSRKREMKTNAMGYIIESFERKLSAKRVGPTYLVEITFDSTDPDRAAKILNAVVEKYITLQMSDQSLLDETWVKDRLTELSAQESAAKKALEDYNRNRGDATASNDTSDKLVAAAESSKNAYDNFRHMLRKMEATQQQSSPVFEASLVTGASPPLRPSWPKVRTVLGISGLGGLILGIAIGLLRDRSRQRIGATRQKVTETHRWAEPEDLSTVRLHHRSKGPAKAEPVRVTDVKAPTST